MFYIKIGFHLEHSLVSYKAIAHQVFFNYNSLVIPCK